MRKTIYRYYCDNCKNEIKGEKTAFTSPDLDLHGLWCAEKQEYIWFKDESFCSFKCAMEWLKLQFENL